MTRDKNKEKVADYNRQWRQENKEAWNKIVKTYRDKKKSENDEEYLEKRREYGREAYKKLKERAEQGDAEAIAYLERQKENSKEYQEKLKKEKTDETVDAEN